MQQTDCFGDPPISPANDCDWHLVREERITYKPPGVTRSANACSRSPASTSSLSEANPCGDSCPTRPVQTLPPEHAHVLPELWEAGKHHANGFTTDGGFAEHPVNHINTLARVPDGMSDADAALVVTAGTSMYGLTELGDWLPARASW